MKAGFVDNRTLKLGIVFGVPKVGDIVTVSYERGRDNDKETVTANYPVQYIVDTRRDKTLCVLGPKVQNGTAPIW